MPRSWDEVKEGDFPDRKDYLEHQRRVAQREAESWECGGCSKRAHGLEFRMAGGLCLACWFAKGKTT